MKRLMLLFTVCLAVLCSTGCGLFGEGVSEPNGHLQATKEPKNAGSEEISATEGQATSKAGTEEKGEMPMKIRVKSGVHEIVYELNQSQAAKDLYAQLPFTVKVEGFGTNEIIFYPPEKLDTTDAPLADAGSGTLAYFSPWADVVMFYDAYDAHHQLYVLGQAVSGAEHIQNLSGTVEITVDD